MTTTTTTAPAKRRITINTAISWGASVVIIGLMFKLLHWPYGEVAIGIGLSVEAILFFLLGVQTLTQRDETVVNTVAAPVHRDSAFEDLLHSSINPNTIDRLQKGFDQFTKTVESVNQITGYAGTTQQMMDEVQLATKQMVELKKNLGELNNIYRAQLDAFRNN